MKYAELLDIEAWVGTTPSRRQEIAEAIGHEHHLVLESLAPFRRGDLPLASYRALDGLFRLVLVPGGTLELGCGDSELDQLRALAEARRAAGAVSGGLEALWLEASTRRGVIRRVLPLLVAQNAIGGFDVERWREEIGELFTDSPNGLPESLDEGLAMCGYRVPWEHEWEWMARGGRRDELSGWGSVVPGDAELHALRSAIARSEGPDDGDRHASIANDFGLLGFGGEAELCLDAFQQAPDTSPASTGVIENRVIKGGAAATHPWQNDSEWQGLLTAHRTRCGGLRYAIGVRLVRDVE